MQQVKAAELASRLPTPNDADLVRHSKPRRGQIDGLKVLLRALGRNGLLLMLTTIVVNAIIQIGPIVVAALALEYVYHPLYYVVGGTGIAWQAIRIAVSLSAIAVARDDEVVSKALARATPLLGLTGHRHPGRDRFEKLSYDRRPSEEAPFRTTIAQMAMIGSEHDAAIGAASDDAGRNEINLTTARVVGRLLDNLRTMTTDEPVAVPLKTVDLEGYASRVERIADGVAPAPQGRRTGDAEADRLIAVAESALIDAPDLVDGVGSSVATLVREHLPRLVDVHRKAIKGADDAARARADETLRRSVAKASSSVYEALAAYQKKRTDDLDIEARFIAERSGTPMGEIA